MFYNSSTFREIRDLQEPSKLFEILTQPDRRGDYPYWTDIWHGIQHYRDFNCKSNSEYFLSVDKIKELENYGLDYSYRDAAGNNFLHYCLGLSRSRNRENRVKEPYIETPVEKYIIESTKEVWKPNNYNRNILFELLSYSSAGVKGEEFFNYVTSYPELDIHIIDKSGRNLMFQALMNPAPFPVINYLVENNISLKQVDKEGFNLLHVFISFNKGTEAKKLFGKIFEEIENIAQKNKYKETFIDHFIDCIGHKDVHKDSQEKYKYWLKVSLNKIIKGEFKKTTESLEGMLKVLEKHKISYYKRVEDEDALTYEKAIKALNYFLLDMDINKSNNKTDKKLKI